MAKHQLRIIFDGVIAVGPPRPDSGAEEKGPFYGVMASSTRRVSFRSKRLGEKPPKYIGAHIPTICTTLTPAADSRPADDTFRASLLAPEWNIWRTPRERLEFRLDGSAKPGPITYDRNIGSTINFDGSFPPKTPMRLASSQLLPDAREIWAERSVLRAGLMSDQKGVPPEAAAQILIPWGDVCAAGFSDIGQTVKVDFDMPHDWKARPILPNAVVFVEAGEVEIASFSMDYGDKLDSLKFVVDRDADIWVANSDPIDFKNDLVERSGEDANGAINNDPDFVYVAEGTREVFPDADRDRVRKVAHVFGSLPRAAGVKKDPSRLTDIDIDFEEYDGLLNGTRGYFPVPRRQGGVHFDDDNCYVCKVRMEDENRRKELVFKSDRS